MLWACLYFSDLPLRALFDSAELAQPCAVIEGPQQRPQLANVSAAAARAGARAGQALAAARALCGGIVARQRDAGAEHRLLHSLAAWAYCFSSHVSLCAPDALLVEVGASLRLFGGWSALERQLRAELAELDFHPAIAVAPLPAAARVLAARQDGFFAAEAEPMRGALAHLPIAYSGLDDAACALLQRVGLSTLRDVFALPRPELARRIGPDALDWLDRLRGYAHDVLPLYRPPDRFAHRIELDDRIEAWPALLFPLRRLCGELALFLAARDGGVQRLTLELGHEDSTHTRIAIELLAPQREARTLYDLVRSRLERAAPAQAVCAIALIADDLPAFKPQHADLFEPKRAQALDWPELAERLRAHLGDGAVRGLAAAPDHRPEHAWKFALPGAQHPSLPPAGKAAAKAQVSAAHEAAAASASPADGSATLTPTLSRQRERENNDSATGAAAQLSPLPLAGEVAPILSPVLLVGDTAPSSLSPLPLAGEVAPQARVRVAHEAAAASTSPADGSATLTPTLSRQREKENNDSAKGAAAHRSPLPPAGEVAPQARVRAAPDAAQASEPRRPRPLWLLLRAIPLRGAAPQVLAGPERIESGWWDGGDARRDYYVILTHEGQCAWAYVPAGCRDGWMLHGWFA